MSATRKIKRANRPKDREAVQSDQPSPRALADRVTPFRRIYPFDFPRQPADWIDWRSRRGRKAR